MIHGLRVMVFLRVPGGEAFRSPMAIDP